MYRPATFAERLNTVLELKNLTKADLSRLTGISKSSLTRYAKGDWEGKQDAVYAISQALDINEAWLMGYDAPMERIDMQALLRAGSELQEKVSVVLQNTSGILQTNDTYNIGCSIHCKNSDESAIIRNLLMRIVQLGVAERYQQLVILTQIIGSVQHMSPERCAELASYAEFLQQK